MIWYNKQKGGKAINLTVDLKTVLQKTGLSYRTLRKYIDLELIPKPQVEYGGPGKKESYFPEDVIEHIKEIQHLKSLGRTLEDIAEMGVGYPTVYIPPKLLWDEREEDSARQTDIFTPRPTERLTDEQILGFVKSKDGWLNKQIYDLIKSEYHKARREAEEERRKERERRISDRRN